MRGSGMPLTGELTLAEVVPAFVRSIPLSSLPAWLLMTTHTSPNLVQVLGSIWIERLSAKWA